MRFFLYAFISLFLLLSLIVSGCCDKSGFSDEKVVRQGLKELNAFIDSAKSIVDRALPSPDSLVERRLSPAQLDAIKKLAKLAKEAKERSMKGLSKDVGGGKSFEFWYIPLSVIDDALEEIIERPDTSLGAYDMDDDLSFVELIKKLLEMDLDSD